MWCWNGSAHWGLSVVVVVAVVCFFTEISRLICLATADEGGESEPKQWTVHPEQVKDSKIGKWLKRAEGIAALSGHNSLIT